MAGLSAGSSPAGGGGKGWLIGAFVAAAAVLGVRACATEEKPTVPPLTTPVAAPERVRTPYYIAVANSANTLTYAYGPDRVPAERAAVDACEAERKLRFSRGAYIAATGCTLLPLVSNYNGESCLATFRNPVQYNTPVHYFPGSAIDIEQNMRRFLHSSAGRLYNQAAHPTAQTTLFCVDYYGKPSITTPGYHLSR